MTSGTRIYPDSEVCRCNGTGAMSESEQHADHGQYMTSLCACRRNLPRRDGSVSWWTCESKTWKWCDDIFGPGKGWQTVVVTASRELPISEDNYPLHRTTANSYMRASISIEQDGERFLTVDQVRDYANWLLKVVDEIDEYDTPVDAAQHRKPA